MNLGGRTLDMQALQQQAQLAMAKMQPKADEAEPPPAGWVRPATPQVRQEAAALERMRQMYG